MKLVVSHPTGNANVRSALKGFSDSDMLAGFHTSIASFNGSLLDHLSSIKLFTELKRRHFDSSLKKFTHLFPWVEMGRIMASKIHLKGLVTHEKGPFCIDAVYKSMDRYVASNLKFHSSINAKAIYAYEDGALSSFKEAKKLSMQCLYDLPTGHWRAARKLLQNELDRRPEWAPTITGFKDSAEKLKRKDDELELSDLILVASQFTASTLNYYPGKIKNVRIIPYGFPPVAKRRQYRNICNGSRLKLLFVGKLSQQKGIADLLEAVEHLNGYVELTIVGRKPVDNCEALNKGLLKHNWIPSLSHDKVLELMKQSDVLVFPSLFDGFGLVITEAMSQGTPVITTDRTAGPDLIENGENGWLINPGSPSSIQSALESLISNPDTISAAGKAAMETANNRPWKIYGTELIQAIEEHFLQVQ